MCVYIYMSVCVCWMGSPGVVVLSWMNQAELALHKVLVCVSECVCESECMCLCVCEREKVNESVCVKD